MAALGPKNKPRKARTIEDCVGEQLRSLDQRAMLLALLQSQASAGASPAAVFARAPQAAASDTGSWMNCSS